MQLAAGGGVGQAGTRSWGGHNATRRAPSKVWAYLSAVERQNLSIVSRLKQARNIEGIPASQGTPCFEDCLRPKELSKFVL